MKLAILATAFAGLVTQTNAAVVSGSIPNPLPCARATPLTFEQTGTGGYITSDFLLVNGCPSVSQGGFKVIARVESLLLWESLFIGSSNLGEIFLPRVDNESKWNVNSKEAWIVARWVPKRTGPGDQTSFLRVGFLDGDAPASLRLEVTAVPAPMPAALLSGALALLMVLRRKGAVGGTLA